MKSKIQKLFFVFLLFVMVALCTAYVKEEPVIYCEEWTEVAARAEAKDARASDIPEQEDGQASDVFTALKSGDIKSLVGVQFGDKLDNDLFEVNGCIGRSCEYRMKDTDDYGITYEFDGKGNCFSGFVIWMGYGNSLGIRFGEDTIGLFTDALGEPDFYGERNDMSSLNMCAEWHFENATLTIREDAGKVYMLTYRAAA